MKRWILTVSALLSGSALAEEWAPVPLPFQTAAVQVIAYAPSQPSRFYAACVRAGVYRSNNRGDSWILATRGLPHDQTVQSLLVDPNHPDIVLAGVEGDVYRTDNGGTSWELWEEDAAASDILPQTFSPTESEVVLGSRSGLVIRSTDSGRTWLDSSNGLPGGTIHEFSFNPSSSNEVLAAVARGSASGVYRSNDSGLSWFLAAPLGDCRSVSWSAADPNYIYAIILLPGPRLYRSTDGGTSFEWPGVNGHMQGALVVRAHPANRNIVFFAGGEWNYDPHSPSYRTRVDRSADAGSSWAQTFVGDWTSIGNPYSKNLIIDPSYPQVVTWTGGGGIFRSDLNGAAPNQKIAGMLNATLSAMDHDEAGHLVLRDVQMNPFYYSSQTGETEVLSRPIYAPSVINRVELVPHQPMLLFECGASPRFSTFEGYLKRSNGNSWEPPVALAPEPFDWLDDIDWIAVSPSANALASTRKVYAWARISVNEESRVFRSDDGGDTYMPMSPFAGILDAVVDPQNDLRVFAMANSGAPVQITTDGGASWQPRSNGLALGSTPLALRMDAENSNHLLSVFVDGRAFITYNGGKRWTPLSLDLQGALPVAADWDARSDRVILATKDHSVYVSEIGFLNSGLETRDLETILYSRTEERIYLGTTRMGLWTIPLPSIDTCTLSAYAVRHGSVSVEPNQTTFSCGSNVQITATADFGYAFSGWTGDATGSENPLTVSMDADKSIGAVFIPATPNAETRLAPDEVLGIFPNPSRIGTTQIVYRAQVQEVVDVSIFDVAGHLIKKLAGDVIASGERAAIWDGRDQSNATVSAGTYFVRMVGVSGTTTKRFVLIR